MVKDENFPYNKVGYRPVVSQNEIIYVFKILDIIQKASLLSRSINLYS